VNRAEPVGARSPTPGADCRSCSYSRESRNWTLVHPVDDEFSARDLNAPSGQDQFIAQRFLLSVIAPIASERAAVSSNEPFLFEQLLQVIERLVKFWDLNVADFTIFRGTANDIHGPSRVHRREIVRRGRKKMIDSQFSQKTAGQFRQSFIVKN
jgi:hypothetical protein